MLFNITHHIHCIVRVRPLLSAELDYPRFWGQILVRPTFMNNSIIRTFIIRGPRLILYTRFLRPKFSTPKYRG